MKKFFAGLAAVVACGLSAGAQGTQGGLYQVVTSTSDFTAGDTIILVSYASDKKVYAMGTYDDVEKNAFHAINIGSTTADYLPEKISLDVVNTSGKVYEYRVGISSSTVSLRNGTVYVAGKKDGTELTLSGTASLWTPYKYTSTKFGFDAVCLQLGTLRFICYSSTYGFRNYTDYTSSSDKTIAYCYKKKGTNTALHIGSTGYATMYYSSNDVELPDGLTAYTMNVTKESGEYKLHLNNIGTSVPKGTAVVLSGTADTDYYPVVYSVAATAANDWSAIEGNMLHGTDVKAMQASGDGYYFKLANHAEKGVGFYWGADNGAAFTNSAHKAYLFLPREMSQASLSDIPFSSLDEGITLVRDIKESKAAGAGVRGYDAAGRSVRSASARGLRITEKGKVMVR